MTTPLIRRSLFVSLYSLGLSVFAPLVSADDCAAIKQSMLKGLRQDSWHTINRMDNAGTPLEMQMIRSGGQIFMRSGTGSWTRTPLTPDMVVQQNESMVSKGTLKLSGCKKTGSDALPQGAADRYEYVTETPGTPPVVGKLWIGSGDGLPYKATSATTESTTTYSGVSAPAVK